MDSPPLTLPPGLFPPAPERSDLPLSPDFPQLSPLAGSGPPVSDSGYVLQTSGTLSSEKDLGALFTEEELVKLGLSANDLTPTSTSTSAPSPARSASDFAEPARIPYAQEYFLPLTDAELAVAMQSSEGLLGRETSRQMAQHLVQMERYGGGGEYTSLRQRIEQPAGGLTLVPNIVRSLQFLDPRFCGGSGLSSNFGISTLQFDQVVGLVKGKLPGLYKLNEWTKRYELNPEALPQVVPWLPVAKLVYARDYAEWGMMNPPAEYRSAWEDSISNEDSALWQVAYAAFALYVIRPSYSTTVHKISPTWKRQLLLYLESITLVDIEHNQVRVLPEPQGIANTGLAATRVLRGATLDGGYEDALQVVITVGTEGEDKPVFSLAPIMSNLEAWYKRAHKTSPSLVEVFSRPDRFPQGLLVFLVTPNFDLPVDKRPNVPMAAFSVRRRLVSLDGTGAFQVELYNRDQTVEILSGMDQLDVLRLPPNVLCISWSPEEAQARSAARIQYFLRTMLNPQTPIIKLHELMQLMYRTAARPVKGNLSIFQSYDMYAAGMFPKVVVFTNFVPLLPSLPGQMLGSISWKTTFNMLVQRLVSRRLFRTIAFPRPDPTQGGRSITVFRTEELRTSEQLPYISYPKKYLCVRLVLDIDSKRNNAFVGLNGTYRDPQSFRDTSICDGGSGLVEMCQQGKKAFEVHVVSTNLAGQTRVDVLKGNGSGPLGTVHKDAKVHASMFDVAYNINPERGPALESAYAEGGPRLLADQNAEEEHARGKRQRNNAAKDAAEEERRRESPVASLASGLLPEDTDLLLSLMGVTYTLLGVTLRDTSNLLNHYWNPMLNVVVLEDPDSLLKDLGIENVVLIIYKKDINEPTDKAPELLTRSRFRVVHQEGHPRAELMLLPFDEPFDHLSSPSMTSHHAIAAIQQIDVDASTPGQQQKVTVNHVDVPVNPSIRSKLGHAPPHHNDLHSRMIPVRPNTRYLHPYYHGVNGPIKVLGGAPSY